MLAGAEAEAVPVSGVPAEVYADEPAVRPARQRNAGRFGRWSM